MLVIRDRCQCDFQDTFVSQAVLLCQREEPSQVVYRSIIIRYGTFSANQLVGYIEEWVTQGAAVINGVPMATFDPNCTVRISDINEPVCESSDSTDSRTHTAVVASTTVLCIITTLMIAAMIWLGFCTKEGKKLYGHCTHDC